MRQKFNAFNPSFMLTLLNFVLQYFRSMLTMWLIYEISTSDAPGRTPRLSFGQPGVYSWITVKL